MRAATEIDIVWLEEEACRDVAVAGGKGASLAEMAQAGLPVPPGFVVSADVLALTVDAERLRALARAGDHAGARALVLACRPPEEAIVAAYERLGEGPVAVRSSACAEDSQTASYAGQQDTFLDVRGSEQVCRRVVECWASFFSERALFYRGKKGSLDDLRIAVVVQRMVAAETSGVLFTCDPVQRRRDRMVIEAAPGLGEQVVSGALTPDHYVVDREGRIARSHLVNGGVLGEEALRSLARLGRELEARFGCPQDVEWAIAGGTLYLLQSRPVTTL